MEKDNEKAINVQLQIEIGTVMEKECCERKLQRSYLGQKRPLKSLWKSDSYVTTKTLKIQIWQKEGEEIGKGWEIGTERGEGIIMSQNILGTLHISSILILIQSDEVGPTSQMNKTKHEKV